MSIIWTEEEIIKLADNASKLSEILEREGIFKQHALRWLMDQHINKLERESEVSSIVETLSQQGIPSDAMAVIDSILGSSIQSDVIGQLNELVSRWQAPNASDPVAVAITDGREGLSALFRSQWSVPKIALQCSTQALPGFAATGVSC